jgi:hypothetical protein
MLIQTILLDPPGAVWTDNATSMGRLDPLEPSSPTPSIRLAIGRSSFESDRGLKNRGMGTTAMKQYGGRPTQLAELNKLLGQIVSQVKSSLGHNFVGAYLQGSFALGDAEMLTWTKLDSPWAQRYAVTTLCRILYTLETGQVASKRVSLLWARDNLDPKWQVLISKALEGRSLGWNHWDPVKPGALEATLVFNEYAKQRATGNA